MTNEEVMEEIKKLKESENVKRAQKDLQEKKKNSADYKLRNRLYQLRWLEKKGRALATNGGEV